MKAYSYHNILKHDSQETGIYINYKNGIYCLTNFVSKHL